MRRPFCRTGVMWLVFLFTLVPNLSNANDSYCKRELKTPLESNMILQYRLATGISAIEQKRFNIDANNRAIFILGMQSTGKTTLAYLLAGNLANVFVTNSINGSIQFFDTAGKIGTGNSMTTLVPDYFRAPRSETIFVDCPAIGTSNDAENIIATSYFLDHTFSLTRKAKFLFTITYKSILQASTLDTVLQNIVAMIPNVDRFKRSFAVIVTKVPRSIAGVEASRKMLLTNIKQYFMTYCSRLRQLPASSDSVDAQKHIDRKMKFVSYILSDMDAERLPNRIGYVVDPNVKGCTKVESFPEILTLKAHLEYVYQNFLQYTDINENDFQFPITTYAKHAIMNFYMPSTINVVRSRLREGLKATKTYFLGKFLEHLPHDTTSQSYSWKPVYSNEAYNTDDYIDAYSFGNVADTEIYEEDVLRDEQLSSYSHKHTVYKTVKDVQETRQINAAYRLTDINKYYYRIQKLQETLETDLGNFVYSYYEAIEINPAQKACVFSKIKELAAQIRFYEKVLNHGDRKNSFIWRDIANDESFELEQLKTFYSWCEKLNEVLGTYDSQRALENIAKNGELTDAEPEDVFEILARFITIPEDVKNSFPDLAQENKEYFANLVIDQIPKVDISCQVSYNNPEKYKVRISGRNVRTLDFLKEDSSPLNWPENCSNATNVDQLLVLAQETYFLDAKIDFSCAKIHVYIIAPSWIHIMQQASSSMDITLSCYIENTAHPDPAPFPGDNGYDSPNASSFIGFRSKYDQSTIAVKVCAMASSGGPGQNGRAGREGKSGTKSVGGRIPKMIGIMCNCRILEVTTGTIFERECGGVRIGRIDKFGNAPRVTYGKDGCWVYRMGDPGDEGEDGKKGGDGGAPGLPGTVLTVGNFRVDEWKLQPGSGGKGGAGGLGGRFGAPQNCPVFYKWIWFPRPNYKWLVAVDECYHVYDFQVRVPSGQKGNDGNEGTSENLGETIPLGIEPWMVINDFKKTFRHRKVKYDMTRELDMDAEFLRQQTPLSFAEDLIALELEYYKEAQLTKGNRSLWEKQQPKYIDYYENFLEVLKGYEKKTGHQLLEGEIKAINYIYITALSKSVALKQNLLSFPKVIDTLGYFRTIADNMETLKQTLRSAKDEEDVQKTKDAIDAEKSRFEAAINDKIEEANYYITNTALPAVQSTGDTLNSLNEELERELKELLKLAQENLDKMKEMKKKLAWQLPLKGYFGYLKIVGNAAMLFGPKGKVAGTAINAVSSVGSSFLTKTEKPGEKKFKIPAAVARAFKTHNKDYFDSKISIIADQLEFTWRTIKKEKNQFKRSVDFGGLKTKAVLLNDSLEILKNASYAWNDPPEVLAKKMNDVEVALQIMKDEVTRLAQNQKMRKNDAGEDEDKKNIETLETVMKVGQASGEMFNIIKDGISDWKKAGELVKDAEKMVNDVESKIKSINKDFIPLLTSSLDAINNAGKNLEGETLVGLSVKKWNLQKMVRTMRQAMTEFTDGLKVQEEFKNCADTLDKSLNLLIELYNHIERYEEKKELADYIANINKASQNSEFGDSKLGVAVTRLRFLSQANLFLHDYQLAINTFKQWVFPLPGRYLIKEEKELVVEDLLSGLNNSTVGKRVVMDEMVKYYMDKVDTLKKHLEVFNTTTQKGDQLLILSIFENNLVSAKPFFIWKSEEWPQKFRKFFQGDEIELKADIDDPWLDWQDGISAVKYKCAKVRLRATDEAQQHILDHLTYHFQVRMTHSGISIYKANGKKYVMHDNPQVYQYSFEEIKGEPVTSSLVKQKVCDNGDFLMSPYTWWTFKLLRGTSVRLNESIIAMSQILNHFGEPGQVQLELEGTGMYLDERNNANSEDLKNLQLDDFYQQFDDASHTNFRRIASKSCGNGREYASRYTRLSGATCPSGESWECFEDQENRDETCKERGWVRYRDQVFQAQCHCCQN